MNITVWSKEFNLNIGEEITVKELRVIYPLTKKYADNEIEMVVQIIKAFSDDKDIEEKVNWLDIAEFTELSNIIGWVISKKK